MPGWSSSKSLPPPPSSPMCWLGGVPKFLPGNTSSFVRRPKDAAAAAAGWVTRRRREEEKNFSASSLLAAMFSGLAAPAAKKRKGGGRQKSFSHVLGLESFSNNDSGKCATNLKACV